MPEIRLTRRQAMVGAAAVAASTWRRAALAQDAAPRRGGIPRVALPRMVDRLDLASHEAWDAAWLQSLVFDTPLRVTVGGDIVAGVGISYNLDAEGRFVDVPVRNGMPLSNGAVVTARDLAASIERSIEITPSGDLWRWSAVEEIDVLHEDRVRLHVGMPDATLPATLASPLVPVMPAGTRPDAQALDALPAGTGPFVPTVLDGGVLRFRPNRHHWVVGRPRFDGCEVVAVEQEIERTARLVTGLVDIVPNVPSLDIPLLEGDPGVALTGDVSRRQCAVVFRLDRAPMDDVVVRRLVASAIDREALVEGATAGTGVASSTLFPPEHWAGLPDRDIVPVSAEEVRARLVAHGLLPGWPIRLACPDSSPALANSAVLLQEQLANAGIAVSIDLLSDDELEDVRRSGDFDLMVTFLPLWNDPHELAHPLLHSEGSSNISGFASRRADHLLARSRFVAGESRRGAYYRELQRIVDDQVPVVPLFATPWLDGVRTRIAGYTEAPPPLAGGVASAWFAPP